jgi:hypothetical protein
MCFLAYIGLDRSKAASDINYRDDAPGILAHAIRMNNYAVDIPLS